MKIADTFDAGVAHALARRGVAEVFAQVDGNGYMAVGDNDIADAGRWSITQVHVLFAAGRIDPDAGEWLFRVGLWTPGGQRDEFLAWYREEHLPILLECADWKGCHFVEAPTQHGCQFLALHRLWQPSALQSPERARSRATPWFERLKRFDWFDEAFTRTLYRKVGN